MAQIQYVFQTPNMIFFIRKIIIIIEQKEIAFILERQTKLLVIRYDDIYITRRQEEKIIITNYNNWHNVTK